MWALRATYAAREGSLARLVAAGRNLAIACAIVGWCVAVYAVDYSIQTLSDSASISRDPVITETKLVIWSAYAAISDSRVEQRIVIHTGDTSRSLFTIPPADIVTSLRPQAQSNHVVWGVVKAYPGTGEAWKLRQVPQPERDRPFVELPAVYRPVVIEPTRQVWQEVSDEELELATAPRVAAQNAEEIGGATNAAAAEGSMSSGETGKAEIVVAESLPAGPVPPITTPSTDKSVLEEKPRRLSSGDTEIFFWRAGQDVIQVTQDNRDDLGPSVWGDLVAWQTAKGWPFGWEIMVWSGGRFIQLTTNFYYDMAPRVHSDQVVWYGWDGHDFEIFLYDHAKSITIQITSNLYDDISPDIWGGVIVWEGYAGVSADVFLWRDGKVTKLSDNVEDDLNPRVWNGQVVWQGFDGEDFEIYHYNGQKTTKLTSNTYDDVNPDIRDGVICWAGYEGNWDAEIYVWDGGPDPRRLTENDNEDRDARTAAGCVVWESVSKTQSVIQLAVPIK